MSGLLNSGMSFLKKTIASAKDEVAQNIIEDHITKGKSFFIY